ncbi:Panacea domain-containing protein [Butyricimonas paravirosa]|uniref:Panacea domain-containing protein n=1 Tax=Butyricimonas paravirosa TaxID=1472417 RepID=UPI0024307933|nr:Panacea domain-containing protein [Butyricimonas paravirosa]
MTAFSHSEIDKLGNTIIYLANKIPNLSKTKVLKLLYLLEHFSARLNRVPFMNLEFEVWKAGPVAKDVYIDLSNEESSRLKEYVKMYSKDDYPGSYVLGLKEFNDDEFSDNDIELMDCVIKEFGNKTAGELVDICHKKNMPWYQIALENGLLEEFEAGRLNSSSYKIDLSQLLDDCDRLFYQEKVEFDKFSRALKK